MTGPSPPPPDPGRQAAEHHDPAGEPHRPRRERAHRGVGRNNRVAQPPDEGHAQRGCAGQE